MTAFGSISGWLGPIRSAVPELDDIDWKRIERLDDLLSACQFGTADAAGTERREWLLRTRKALAEDGFTRLTLPSTDGGLGRPAVVQTLAQFVCGFHDLDLRDATGLGHGALALDLTAADRRREWLRRLAAGELVGIAATERHGGTRLNEITAAARRVGDGIWSLCGEKVWVSRLAESAAFAVFFRDPDGGLSAALLDAGRPGLERVAVTPSGLAGWTWGTLAFREVEVNVDTDLIGPAGSGGRLFHRHFARFRPLVTATALGAAASTHTLVARTLAARQRIGVVGRIRDNAYILLGRAYAEICAGLLAAIATTRLAALDDEAAGLWANTGKASGVDAACRAVGELIPLVGASGFAAGSRLVKVRNDLAALVFADGVHDSLYRAGGRFLLGIDGREERER
ncbi:acyl-CoA dehydrogenase family protein [Flindersiella endophytica]